MSDFPGEMTNSRRSAPARIIRSTRYSETARGRSVPSTIRLPTGSSSFENASGWMRLPRPAAGMTPHMSRLHEWRMRGGRRARIEALDQPGEFAGALHGCVLVQNALARAARHRREIVVRHVERSQRVGRVARDDDLL